MSTRNLSWCGVLALLCSGCALDLMGDYYGPPDADVTPSDASDEPGQGASLYQRDSGDLRRDDHDGGRRDGAAFDGSYAVDGGAPSSDAGGDQTPPTCAGALLTVSVIGPVGADSVVGMYLLVPPNSTRSICTAPTTDARLETAHDAIAKWTGVSCKDGPVGDRCEFNLTLAGATILATE